MKKATGGLLTPSSGQIQELQRFDKTTRHLEETTKKTQTTTTKKKPNSPSSTITKCRQIITYWAENRMKLAEETGTNLTF